MHFAPALKGEAEVVREIDAALGPSDSRSDVGRRILIIDDDPVTFKTLQIVLRAHGYEVFWAIDGAEAIRVLRERKPDLMLIDVGLPPDVAAGGIVSWDGFQVALWARYTNARGIPSIIISGTDNMDYRDQAVAVGAHCFVPKPIDHKLLLDSIAFALRNEASGRTALPELKMAS